MWANRTSVERIPEGLVAGAGTLQVLQSLGSPEAPVSVHNVRMIRATRTSTFPTSSPTRSAASEATARVTRVFGVGKDYSARAHSSACARGTWHLYAQQVAGGTGRSRGHCRSSEKRLLT